MKPADRNPSREGIADVPNIIGYIRSGFLDALEKALEQNPKQANVQDSNGLTALHWAANHRFYAAVMLILKTEKADVSLKDCRGRTALDHAISGGHQKIIEAIQKASAESA